MKKILFIILFISVSGNAQQLPINKILEIQELPITQMIKQLMDNGWIYNGLFFGAYRLNDREPCYHCEDDNEIIINKDKKFFSLLIKNKKTYDKYIDEIKSSSEINYVEDILLDDGFKIVYKYKNYTVSTITFTGTKKSSIVIKPIE
ncbi:hypothetical protein SAMN05444372_11920 [Flavobacterium micromati]|uniref:Uncharacterized protein n=1 Tax=Flavobacterium micromati TaxID=229205 RepID=A0A1M5QTF3_9FLAO|nr:hypothetical protein [Flavobacterium micromati]SHH16999.1 hypothetical protein SAMN05444372_11920 [Flavobacterium micromati]